MEVTVHSVAQLTTHQPNIRKLEGTWSLVETLVADEVSMIGCRMLAKLNNRLVTAKHSPSDIPFGGIDMIFAGKKCNFHFNAL